ncbi:aldolase/citrate lyase family protein [Escherichia coli]
MVYHALQHPLYRDIETIVRVNALGFRMGCKRPGSRRSRWCGRCRLPKTDTASGCSGYRKRECLRIKACGREPGCPGLLAIESPLGITRAVEMAQLPLIGIALGAEDYVRNLRTEHYYEGIELLFARCSILQAARSAGMRRSIPSSDANNEAGFLQEAAHINGWALTANR